MQMAILVEESANADYLPWTYALALMETSTPNTNPPGQDVITHLAKRRNILTQWLWGARN